MENEFIKCSLKNHSEIDAITFCQDCKLYMCNKCYNHHTELFGKELLDWIIKYEFNTGTNLAYHEYEFIRNPDINANNY
jgi:hypothetical protein